MDRYESTSPSGRRGVGDAGGAGNNDFRRIATRYDRLAQNYLTTIISFRVGAEPK